MLLNLWTTALFDARATGPLHILQQTFAATGVHSLLESALLPPSTLTQLQQWGPLWLERLQREFPSESSTPPSTFALHPLPQQWQNSGPVITLHPLAAFVAALVRSSQQVEFPIWACPSTLHGATLWSRLPVERFLCLSRQVWQHLHAQGIDKERLALLPSPSLSSRPSSPLLVIDLAGLPKERWETVKITLKTLSEEYKLAFLHFAPSPPLWETTLSTLPHSLLTTLQSAHHALSEARFVVTASDLYWSSLAPDKTLLWPALTAAQREDSLFLQRHHKILQLPTISNLLDVLKEKQKQQMKAPETPVSLEQLQEWASAPATPLPRWPISKNVSAVLPLPAPPAPEEWKQRTAQLLLEIKRTKERQTEASEHLKHWQSRKALAKRAGVQELEKEAGRQCKRLEEQQKQEEQSLVSLERDLKEWRAKKPQRGTMLTETTKTTSVHEQDFARLEIEEELKALKQRLSFHRDQLDTLKDED